MNISSNPWSFVPSDVNTADIVTSPGGLTLNDDGTVTLTLSGAFSESDLNVDDRLTIFQPTDPAYQGFYKVYSVTSSTIYILVPINHTIPVGTSPSGDGTAAQTQYSDYIRAEDISWQNVTALGQVLIIVDKNGNPV